MNKNEVYEAEVEEPIAEEEEYEEEYEDESEGYGYGAALGIGLLGGILIHRIYQNQVKPRVAKAKTRWAERKALKSAAPSEDDYDEAEDDEPVKEAPKKK